MDSWETSASAKGNHQHERGRVGLPEDRTKADGDLSVLAVVLQAGRLAWNIWRHPPRRMDDGDDKLDPSKTLVMGDRVYLANIALSGSIILAILAFSKGRCSHVSKASLLLNQVALINENFVRFLGKFMGPGPQLLRLTKGRFLFHAAAMPLLAVVVTEIACKHHLLSEQTHYFIRIVLVIYMCYEIVAWSRFSVNNYAIVDNRRSKDHEQFVLAGTLAYDSGRVLALGLPAIAMVLYELFTGMRLVFSPSKEAHATGAALLVSSIVVWISCANSDRPDIQLFGQNFQGLSYWVILVFIASSS